MKKSNLGEFKKNSDINKMWIELTKDIKIWRKPMLFLYFTSISYKWSERLFAVKDKLYCSINTDYPITIPNFAIEMKGSEFYKIMESEEENN
jgi:hypothetical protein